MSGGTPKDPVAEVHVFNVNQGDSILVRFHTGELLVVDCNVPMDSIDGEPPVLRQLREWSAETGSFDIEILCLTHTDADHYRGMTKVIDWVYKNRGRVKNLILPTFPSMKDVKVAIHARHAELASQVVSTEAKIPRNLGKLRGKASEFVTLRKKLLNIQKDIKKRGRLFRTPSGFCEFWLKDGNIRAYILGPTSNTVDAHVRKLLDDVIGAWLEEDELGQFSSNALSCVLWLIIGSAAVMLTGDSTSDAWEDALDEYEKAFRETVNRGTESQLVKAPHHGSRSSSRPGIWERVLSQNGILMISAGNNAQYHHPHEETLNDVLAVRRDVRIYCTNVCPGHAKRLGTLKEETLAEENDWKDQALLTGSPQQFSNPRTEYHGTCVFEIHGDGEIVPRPTNDNPRPMCERHSAEGIGGLAQL